MLSRAQPRAAFGAARTSRSGAQAGLPAAASALRRGGRGRAGGAVSVVAFRDAHRAEQLLSASTEFAHHWMEGRAEGPTERVMGGLRSLVDADVRADVRGLLTHTRDVGPDGLARLLSSEHRPPGLSLKHWHNRVCAADEDRDVVFCLLELKAEDERGEPRSCYQVLKLDLLYDDGARRVTAFTERGQWDAAGDDLGPLLLQEQLDLQQRQRGEGPSEEEGGVGARGGPVAAGGEVMGMDLPVERITAQSKVGRFTKGLTPDELRKSAEAWVRARGSGANTRQELEPLLSPGFRLWDAYGLLPLVCSIGDRQAAEQGMRAAQQGAQQGGTTAASSGPAQEGRSAGGVASGAPLGDVSGARAERGGGAGAGGGEASGYHMALVMGGGGHVANREMVYDMLDGAKAEYDVDITLTDAAPSYTHNVVFSHWTARMTPRGGRGGSGPAADAAGHVVPLVQECVEIDIFDSDGRLSDVWMFRDALDAEKHAIMARRQQVGAQQQQQQQHGKGHHAHRQ